MSAGAAIVVVTGTVAVIVVVVWFFLNRKHPESGASHSDPQLRESSPNDAVDEGRPAGPGAEADGVARPGQPTPGDVGPRT